MRAATLHAARGLLLDLLAISPALSGARLARRLGAECAELARGRHRPPRSRPSRDSEPQTLLSHVHRKPEKLSIQLPPETMARLRGAGEVAFAPLAAHVGRGSVTLLRSGAPGLTWEGPVFLFLRNLLADAGRLIEAWESGEPAFVLPFGTHELRWDLTADEVRAQEEAAEASAVAAGEDRGGRSRVVCRRDPAPRQRRAGGGLARAGARAAHALHRSGERGSAPRAGRGRRSAAPGGARKARVPRAWADPPPRLSRDLAQASCRRPACRSPRAGPAGGRVQRAPRRPGPAQRRRDLARARGARSGEPRLGALLRRAGRGPGAARCAQRRGPLEAPPARSKAARTAMAALCRRAA